MIHSDDFYHAERQSRAVIDIVEVTYPQNNSYSRRVTDKVVDPFDIWFDQNINTFDQAQEEISDYEASDELARIHRDSNIEEMVEAYLEEYTRMEQNYRDIFKLDYQILKELGINKDHVRDGLKKKMSGLKIKYWGVLFKRLDAITSRLTTKSSQKLLDKLTANNTVDFTVGNAYAVVLWAIKNANQYFDDQLVELFRELSTFEGVLNYKSNQRTWEKSGWRYNATNDEYSHYALDYRIVVSVYRAISNSDFNGYNYPGNLSRNAHDLIADVIAVFSNLGFSTSSIRSYHREWDSGTKHEWHETGSVKLLFDVRAYKNGNLHFRFMPAAIRALNIEVARILKWVSTKEEVVEEMGYSMEEVEKHFNTNVRITVNNLPALMPLVEEKNELADEIVSVLTGEQEADPEPVPEEIETEEPELQARLF